MILPEAGSPPVAGDGSEDLCGLVVRCVIRDRVLGIRALTLSACAWGVGWRGNGGVRGWYQTGPPDAGSVSAEANVEASNGGGGSIYRGESYHWRVDRNVAGGVLCRVGHAPLALGCAIGPGRGW